MDDLSWMVACNIRIHHCHRRIILALDRSGITDRCRGMEISVYAEGMNSQVPLCYDDTGIC